MNEVLFLKRLKENMEEGDLQDFTDTTIEANEIENEIEDIETSSDYLRSTDNFKNFLSKSDLDQIEKYAEELKDNHEGQLQILEDAKEGKAEALKFLYKEYLPLTKKVYWKYYVGPSRHYGKTKINDESQQDFASMAYILLSGGLHSNPFKTFNPNIFSSEANLIKQFSYYFYRYLQNEAIKLWKSEKRHGLTGSLSNNEDITVNSYDAYNDNIETEEASVESHEDEVTAKIVLDDFSEYLSSYKNPNFKIVFDGIRQGVPTSELAEQLNISEQYVNRIWQRIKKVFMEYSK